MSVSNQDKRLGVLLTRQKELEGKQELYKKQLDDCTKELEANKQDIKSVQEEKINQHAEFISSLGSIVGEEEVGDNLLMLVKSIEKFAGSDQNRQDRRSLCFAVKRAVSNKRKLDETDVFMERCNINENEKAVNGASKNPKLIGEKPTKENAVPSSSVTLKSQLPSQLPTLTPTCNEERSMQSTKFNQVDIDKTIGSTTSDEDDESEAEQVTTTDSSTEISTTTTSYSLSTMEPHLEKENLKLDLNDISSEPLIKNDYVQRWLDSSEKEEEQKDKPGKDKVTTMLLLKDSVEINGEPEKVPKRHLKQKADNVAQPCVISPVSAKTPTGKKLAQSGNANIGSTITPKKATVAAASKVANKKKELPKISKKDEQEQKKQRKKH